MNGDSQDIPHEILFWQRGFSKAVRTNQWKLLLNDDSGDTLLYDIVQDPFENKNVMQAHKTMAESLLNRHSLWSSELAHPLWPSMVYYQYRDGDVLHYFDQ